MSQYLLTTQIGLVCVSTLISCCSSVEDLLSYVIVALVGNWLSKKKIDKDIRQI